MTTSAEPLFRIEKLHQDHDLTLFDCGNAALTSWLRKFAWTNQRADSAVTYVALGPDGVAAYYSLAAGSVQKQESPQRIAKGLANHPVGVVLLARLAVDKSQQGRGLGKALLFDALSRISEAAEIIAARAVLVHAIDEEARRFYAHFGFEPCPIDPFQMMLLMKDLRRALS